MAQKKNRKDARGVYWPMSQIEFRKQRKKLNIERDMVMNEIDQLKRKLRNRRRWLPKSVFDKKNAQANELNDKLVNLVKNQFVGHKMLDLHSMWVTNAKIVVSEFLNKAIELGYRTVNIMTGYGNGTLFANVKEHINSEFPKTRIILGSLHPELQLSSMMKINLQNTHKIFRA